VFVIIGALEPGKNFVNCMHALTDIATKEDQFLQVIVLGAADDTELKPRIGPYWPHLLNRTNLKFAGMVSEAVKRTILTNSTALINVSK
jgi:hypothetical protein